MSKHTIRRSVRPMLEALEDRCTPAGTVTGSLTLAPAGGNVWTLTGDVADNKINVASTGTAGAFTVSDGGGTTVAGVTNPTKVEVIVFNMQGGSDTVIVNGAKLRKMIFMGGDGNNTFSATSFRLTKLQAVNGTGFDSVTLRNFKIDGNVNINNGDGGSDTFMGTVSAAAGFNNVAGNVNITNGAGFDETRIADTNVGGNITANNGTGDGTNAGHFAIYNLSQTGKRAVVGGNVTATFQNGIVNNGILDTVVHGNVLFNNGSGASGTSFDGYSTSLPVVIQGRLKFVGSGTNLVTIGRDYKHTGLKVGQNLVIDVKNPTDLTLEAFNLIVSGQTKII